MKKLLSIILLGGCMLTAYGSEKLLTQVVTSSDGEVETAKLLYNDQGRLRWVYDNPDNEQGVITFEYDDYASEGVVSLRAGGPMWRQYQAVTHIGENGWIHDAEYSYFAIGESGSMTFSYDDAGHLVKVEDVSDYQRTVYDLTYSDDNLVSVGCIYDFDGFEEEGPAISFEYSDIPNAGKMMLYDRMYGIDLGVLEYAYFAGLMGTSCDYLPSSITITDVEDSYSSQISWKLDADGYPVEMKSDGVIMSLEWDGGASIDAVLPDSSTILYYSIDGTSRSALTKGLNIVRNPDGSYSKIIK